MGATSLPGPGLGADPWMCRGLFKRVPWVRGSGMNGVPNQAPAGIRAASTAMCPQRPSYYLGPQFTHC